MLIRLLILSTVLTSFAACYEEDAFVDDPIDDIGSTTIDAELRDYFDAFAAAAEVRGLTVSNSLYQIEGRIESIDDGDVIGECWYGGHGPNEIRIDRSFWRTATAIDREFVVFHELGHCYLDRDHTEAAFGNGLCRSIMASGAGDCINGYTLSTRERYLDELFE